jgi:hypothetical protein
MLPWPAGHENESPSTPTTPKSLNPKTPKSPNLRTPPGVPHSFTPFHRRKRRPNEHH